MDQHLQQIFRQTKADPSMDNKVLLHEHYRRAGIPICNCESATCLACAEYGGLGCIRQGSQDVWIQYIGIACIDCAMQTPLEYHGYVDLHRDPSGWKVCRCPWCRDLDLWSRRWIKTQTGVTPYPRNRWKFGEFVDKQYASGTRSAPPFIRAEMRHKKSYRVQLDFDDPHTGQKIMRIWGQAWIPVSLSHWPRYDEYLASILARKKGLIDLI